MDVVVDVVVSGAILLPVGLPTVVRSWNVDWEVMLAMFTDKMCKIRYVVCSGLCSCKYCLTYSSRVVQGFTTQ